MRFLIVGAGSIGKRRMGILNGLDINTIDICDQRAERLEESAKQYNIEGRFTDCRQAMARKPDVVIICTPPVFHIPIAKTFAEAGAGLFIEKPLAHDMTGVSELISLVERKNVIGGIAYSMRFHPGIQLLRETVEKGVIGRVYSVRAECGQYLPDWHPYEDYRSWYMSKKDEGGGAILDISHEIDYLRWFFGEVEDVGCFYGKVSNLEMDADDLAEIILRFKNGIIGSIHLDLLQRTYRRTCQIIGEKGTILWDYTAKEIRVYTVEKGKWEVLTYQDARSQMFINETRYFIECFQKKQQPQVSIENAAKTLAVAVAAKESSRTRAFVKPVV